jgi:glycosyltransferase involved in cell wall biosynthesis
MSLDSVFPVMIARDAGATLERTLNSLRDFPEVLVYDNGSVDATREICARYPNVRVVTGEFSGFGPTKAHAASLARGDWVLSIDADEYLSPELLDAIRSLRLDDAGVAYAIERCNLFMGKHVRHGGWGDNWLVRLFDRRTCSFSDRAVHEKVVVPDDVRVERLDGVLWHQAITELGQFLTKIELYSQLSLLRNRPTHNPFVISIMTVLSMFRSYVVKRGFLDGWRGLVIAFFDGAGVFYRYMLRYAKNEERSDGEADKRA